MSSITQKTVFFVVASLINFLVLQAKTASTEVSTAATVPSVTATVVLTNYDVANFSSVATKVGLFGG